MKKNFTLMELFVRCTFGPRLLKVYREGPIENVYQPMLLERFADKIITTASTVTNVGVFATPFILIFIYKKGITYLDDNKFGLIRLVGIVGCLMAISYIIRGIGRFCNQQYVDFLMLLTAWPINHRVYMEGIRKYDFEFHAWPATYVLDEMPSEPWSKRFPKSANYDLPFYQRVPIQILAFIATHAFALRLVYPGSFGLISGMFTTDAFHGRARLVENFNGQRTKLKTVDGNEIDSMFVDNRHRTAKGNTLVVCCEGNSGFYETGLIGTPIAGGYSAISWNHPGFLCSTGVPFPSQEVNAVDVVMQHSIEELGFKPEQIVMFGWSIGGYTATWAAITYRVQALLLDATFDDLLPLAENVTPWSWSLLVKEVIRSYINLNIAEMLKSYDGPLQLIRRTDDEVICICPGIIASNRGNFLVMSIIEHRHPLPEDMDPVAWNMALLKCVATLDSKRPSLDSTKINEYDKRALRLVKKYMRDYQSTHCTALPIEHFEGMMMNISG